MNKDYKKEYKQLDVIPNKISEIYIIPSKPYNGFWGENGYNSFDFVFGHDEIYGWMHWEGDVISIESGKSEFKIDSEIGSNYIRLYTHGFFEISGIDVSTLIIKNFESHNKKIYWYLDSEGEPVEANLNQNALIDEERKKRGNFFNTLEEAERFEKELREWMSKNLRKEKQ